MPNRLYINQLENRNFAKLAVSTQRTCVTKKKFSKWFIYKSFFFLILILGSCHPSPWIYQSVYSDYPQFNSSQVTYTAHDPFQEAEVQILNGKFGKVVFFNALCGELKNDLFTLQIEESQYHYKGTVMEGNQRLMLPLEAAEQLIGAIFKGCEITVIMDHYHAILTPIKNFKFLKKHHLI